MMMKKGGAIWEWAKGYTEHKRGKESVGWAGGHKSSKGQGHRGNKNQEDII